MKLIRIYKQTILYMHLPQSTVHNIRIFGQSMLHIEYLSEKNKIMDNFPIYIYHDMMCLQI